MLLIKLVSDEAEAGETRPGWMRLIAMEIMRWCAFLLYTNRMALIYTCHTRAGSVGTSNSCVAFGQCHDTLATNSDNGSTPGTCVFKLLVATSQGLVTSCPSLLGVFVQIQGVGVSESTSMSYSHRHSLDSITAMVATATRDSLERRQNNWY